MMQRITWSSPADILERIIRYEAVHMIQGWDDLRRRLQPSDRRCYAFFHPSLADEPLIFVEVALTKDIPSSIQAVLADDRKVLPAEEATTAVFYSISNCQPGLRGISFGNFLIKQVVEDLSRDLPSLKTFVTLSPAPGFGGWLKRAAADADGLGGDSTSLARLGTPDWHRDPTIAEQFRPLLLSRAAAYYLEAKAKNGQPLDPVARFHLGNGARLERLNWLGDTSSKGLREAAGLMVNYLYDLNTIETNHEAFANQGVVAASPAIQRLLRDFPSAPTPEARNV
jgi:malonyl-CoA decarboxylase